MSDETPILTNAADIASAFSKTRAVSEAMANALTPEDWMLQSMPDTSPAKWNLAHTTWFFETFILSEYVADYTPFHPQFGYLFNSYYNQIGTMHPRPLRGLLSRPTADEVLRYRRFVNDAVLKFLSDASKQTINDVAPLFALGCAHEQQHQELFLTDIKHGLAQNPLSPAPFSENCIAGEAPSLKWISFDGGLCKVGWDGAGFAFDNEGPRHNVYLEPFVLANRPVTNADFIDFIEDGGYQNATHWLSDAWELVKTGAWSAPPYWRRTEGRWCEYTLFGQREINPGAPVCHVSYYEAAAFASWADARLPTEYEWEYSSNTARIDGNFLEEGAPGSPRAAKPGEGLLQMFGDVWEWTASPYIAYPGYSTPEGAIGEYNGKFMSGQMVLRGGSCATPKGHIRRSYRNFFPPAARWQFSGLRLARNV